MIPNKVPEEKTGLATNDEENAEAAESVQDEKAPSPFEEEDEKDETMPWEEDEKENEKDEEYEGKIT